MLYDYDFVRAEREFERSIELNPRYATAHQWFGVSLALMGRHEEAFTELKRAVHLDPLSIIINASLGFAYLCARRYD
jgi:tetratricopeptide (TPR) repeat protein